MDHTVQNRPGSGLDGLVRVWPNASGLEASWGVRIIGSGFWQGATGPLPVCHFQTQLQSSTDVPDHIVQNHPGSHLVLSDCARFWPNGSGPEASRCVGIMWPASGQSFPADPDWVQPVYWGLILMVFRLRRPSHPSTPAPKNLKHSVRTIQQCCYYYSCIAPELRFESSFVVLNVPKKPKGFLGTGKGEGEGGYL